MEEPMDITDNNSVSTLGTPPGPSQDSIDQSDSKMTLQLYRLVLEEGGPYHTVLGLHTSSAPASASAKGRKVQQSDNGTGNIVPAHDGPANVKATSAPTWYNIAMVDVSGSMHGYWKDVMEGWNEHIAPILTGTTDIYTFGYQVKFRRKGVLLQNSDNDNSSTNLTEALRVVYKQVLESKSTNVRVFIITDGHHNCSQDDPQDVINTMTSPAGKTVEVYLLGVGRSFPAFISLDIRSHLHSGSASCPSIFWSRMDSDEAGEIETELVKIQEEIKKGLVKVSLSIPGKIVPCAKEFKVEASSGEFIYYEQEPESILANLQAYSEGKEIAVNQEILVADGKLLIFNLFKQWNSVVIQMHRNKTPVDSSVFELMKKLFEFQYDELTSESGTGDSIRERLLRKTITTLKTEFDTQMNLSKNMINLESKYSDEMELAEQILKTTVQSRYDNKVLKMRGHSFVDWQKDMQVFIKIFEGMKVSIRAIPPAANDECCHILFTSFLSDLQDDSIQEVFALNKMDFLTTFNFTGIPVLAPTRDSAQINSWTFHIKKILLSPFEIVSQRALESSYALGIGVNESSEDKEVELQQGNKDSATNIIVPIIPRQHCNLLKRLVRTNVFCVGTTFCILKNALVLDHSCHLAALACIWMKTINEHPVGSRPEFIKKRLGDVEGTARLYMDRETILKYTTMLVEDPAKAVATEFDYGDKNEEEGVSSKGKSESIIKPTFLTYMIRSTLQEPKNREKVVEIVRRILIEFLGRCLSNYPSTTPFMDLLLPNTTAKSQADHVKNLIPRVMGRKNLSGTQLLSECYYPDEVIEFTKNQLHSVADNIVTDKSCEDRMKMEIAPNAFKVQTLKHSGSAGNINWEGLRAWVRELTSGYPDQKNKTPLLTEDQLDTLFCRDSLTIYLHHALLYRQSKLRAEKTLILDIEVVKKAIHAKLDDEYRSLIFNTFIPEAAKCVIKTWKEEYLKVHSSVALPLTRQQIIEEATARGIVEVTLETFSKVYKYREDVMMCRNCCHIKECPWFLNPNKRFNCHIEVERKVPSFPHHLHKNVASSPTDLGAAVSKVKDLIVLRKKNKASNANAGEDENQMEGTFAGISLDEWAAQISGYYSAMDTSK